MNKGKVYLIGAGPGDSGLLTLKGLECLKNVDVVLYDALVADEIISWANPSAKLINVGKRGRFHIKEQGDINRLLVKEARKGKIIARLKGGDPFVFGRGGEEVEFLARNRVPFEIVPGVTSAVAAPAYAGIPVTHRDWTSTLAILTGHEDPTKKGLPSGGQGTGVDFRALSKMGTVVFLMGMSRLKQNMDMLMKAGKNPMTPVGVVRWGTTGEQETLTSNVKNIAHDVKRAGLGAPAVVVVGGVVDMRKKLRWFDKSSLLRKRVLVTRARHQASDISRLLAREGAIPVEMPTIEFRPPKSYVSLDSAIKNLRGYDYIIFTSVNGVESFFDRLYNNKKDVRTLGPLEVAAIGSATADALLACGIKTDIVAKEFRAEDLLKKLLKRKVGGKKFLIPRAAEARPILENGLRKAGARVTVVPAYRMIRPRGIGPKIRKLLKEKKIDLITFASSSTVTNFARFFKKRELKSLLKGVKVASIGPVTRQTARALGIRTHIMPSRYTIPSLVSAIKRYFL